MPKWLDINSLKFKLWTYFALFAALIMVILWLLQIIFLGTYYETMKGNEIKKIGAELIENFESSDFEEQVNKTSFNNGFIIRVYSEEGQVVTPSNEMELMIRPPSQGRFLFREYKGRIDGAKNQRILYSAKDTNLRSNTVVYGAKISSEGKNYYLMIYSPLAPVGSTKQVLQNQLIIVTIVSLLFAFVLSYFIAKKLARPITKITKSASRLAAGSYDVVFEDGGYTEINQLAHALNFTTGELSKTDKLRRELIANVSHDLRTPLTIVKSYAEMIRDLSGSNPEKRALHTKVIIEESDRLSALVSDMMDLSKMESGVMPLSKTVFDLAKTTEQIMLKYRTFCEKKGYVFRIHCEENVLVFADQRRIEQVIYNLISNAVNYSWEDKTIDISVKKTEKGGVFQVTDNGEGIRKEDLPRIWERYYRSQSAHKCTSVGTGIGLCIVKNILNLHQGRFGVESKEKKGTTFWFELQKKE